MKQFVLLAIVAATGALATGAADGAGPQIDFAKSTPVGSWQVREVEMQDHRGRTSVSQIRTSLVGEETRDGVPCYWVETEMTEFKVGRHGDRKAKDRTIVKSLVERSALEGDLANAVQNITGFGREIIMQSGDQQPMRIAEGGMLAQTMLNALGTRVNYTFDELGTESVTVPAGEFKARKIAGKGSVETHVVIKTIRVDSESEMWLSDDVPFGIVKMVSHDQVNGRPQTQTAVVTEYGTSGATSAITGEPREMPTLPFGQ